MNQRLFVLLAHPGHIEVFGLDDQGAFSRLARPSSWSETRAVFSMLPAYRRRFLLVAIGSIPPESFLVNLAPDFDSLVFVPRPWLDEIPRHRTRLRALRAARIAESHLAAPLQTHAVILEEDLPF